MQGQIKPLPTTIFASQLPLAENHAATGPISLEAENNPGLNDQMIVTGVQVDFTITGTLTAMLGIEAAHQFIEKRLQSLEKSITLSTEGIPLLEAQIKHIELQRPFVERQITFYKEQVIDIKAQREHLELVRLKEEEVKPKSVGVERAEAEVSAASAEVRAAESQKEASEMTLQSISEATEDAKFSLKAAQASIQGLEQQLSEVKYERETLGTREILELLRTTEPLSVKCAVLTKQTGEILWTGEIPVSTFADSNQVGLVAEVNSEEASAFFYRLLACPVYFTAIMQIPVTATLDQGDGVVVELTFSCPPEPKVTAENASGCGIFSVVKVGEGKYARVGFGELTTKASQIGFTYTR